MELLKADIFPDNRENSRKRSKDNANETLKEKFKFWLECNGVSHLEAATLLKYPTHVVTSYIMNQPGEYCKFETDLKSFLNKEYHEKTFCPVKPTLKIWDLLKNSKDERRMAIISGPAGIGKTLTLNKFVNSNYDCILITAASMMRSQQVIIRSIGSVLNVCHDTIYTITQGIIDHLRENPRLVIIDESHFLAWESYEALRFLHDQAKVGVVFCGMPKLYSQMKGKGGNFLYDQLYSRISAKYCFQTSDITEEDINMLCESVYGHFDKKCLNFLYRRALEPGHFRSLSMILNRVAELSVKDVKIEVSLLQGINNLFTI